MWLQDLRECELLSNNLLFRVVLCRISFAISFRLNLENSSL